MYLQTIVEQFEAEDSMQILGWNDYNDSLVWCELIVFLQQLIRIKMK